MAQTIDEILKEQAGSSLYGKLPEGPRSMYDRVLHNNYLDKQTGEITSVGGPDL